MRKTVPYVAAWFFVGVAAVGLASTGVSMVGRQVTDSTRSAPLSAAQVRAELADGADASSTTELPVTTSTTVPGPSTTVSRPASNDPRPVGETGATTPTTVPPPPVPPVPASTETYNLVGGTATLRFAPTGVTVLAAVPNAGFSVEVSAAHDDGARVEFESEDHRSRVDGWWADGPRHEVREDD